MYHTTDKLIFWDQRPLWAILRWVVPTFFLHFAFQLCTSDSEVALNFVVMWLNKEVLLFPNISKNCCLLGECYWILSFISQKEFRILEEEEEWKLYSLLSRMLRQSVPKSNTRFSWLCQSQISFVISLSDYLEQLS